MLAFFLPALKPRERRWFIPTFAAAVALFILGTVFCYCIILNPAFQWLTDQASGFATVLPEAGSWVDIIIKFEIGFGIGFEMPLIVFYLVMFRVVPYEKLRARWREVYVGLLIFSAMVTPDASPVTMGLMFAAMIGLYELSLLVARIALKRRNKNAEARAKREEEEAAEAREDKENFVLNVSSTDFIGFNEKILTDYMNKLGAIKLGEKYFYEETPYADVKEDILKMARAINLAREGRKIFASSETSCVL